MGGWKNKENYDMGWTDELQVIGMGYKKAACKNELDESDQEWRI